MIPQKFRGQIEVPTRQNAGVLLAGAAWAG